MLKPHYVLLLVSLVADGGSTSTRPDAGPSGKQDGGISAITDGGATAGIRWPTDLRPLATLDGPAILAAHAALQRVLESFPKQDAGACESSARSLDVVVGQEGGVYFVRIDRRLDRCGWPAGSSLEFDWFELYAVSPEGKVLARRAFMP
ncbi:hypothetical protein [Corallococcus sp. CA053C]|uniref:hypothetical protein n=1 Tax=Corallococcus sp. CA053C TaxID=2316732 RepID=UPI001F27DB6D|nr:hypothetical protein [Corallococcus sp. CA053C]